MRVIERDMVRAVRAILTGERGREWRSGNTTVRVWRDAPGLPRAAAVLLHGNHIATIGAEGVVDFTLAGWNTPTTRSRVNAILSEFAPGNRVHCRDFAAHHNGEFIGAREWRMVVAAPFVS